MLIGSAYQINSLSLISHNVEIKLIKLIFLLFLLFYRAMIIKIASHAVNFYLFGRFVFLSK